MDFFTITYQDAGAFFLILTRVGILLFMFPLFNTRIIPVSSKAGISLMITFLLFPLLSGRMPALPESLPGLVQMVTGELIIGMILGLLIQLFFEGVRIMGQMVGYLTGFAIANVLDPQSGIQVSVLSNFAYFVALMLFLLLNGHHALIGAVKESFDILRPGAPALSQNIFREILQASGEMFTLAVRIGAPAIAALLFTKVAFGLITKLIPQMNIMIVAFPVEIVIGLLFFGVCLLALLAVMRSYVGGLDSLLLNTMGGLKG